MTLQQVALVLHLQLSFKSTDEYLELQPCGVILMLRPRSLHQGGDREAEIKGAHPEAPK